MDVTGPAPPCGSLVAHAQEAPCPARGVFHGAMVLDDAMMKDLTGGAFPESLFIRRWRVLEFRARPFAEQAQFDFLVFYSSISAVVGNRGQTELCRRECRIGRPGPCPAGAGFPALSINWGALAESGWSRATNASASILSTAGITGLTNQRGFRGHGKGPAPRHPADGGLPGGLAEMARSSPPSRPTTRVSASYASARRKRAEKMWQPPRSARLWPDNSKEQRLRALEEHLQESARRVRCECRRKYRFRKSQDQREWASISLMVLELSLGHQGAHRRQLLRPWNFSRDPLSSSSPRWPKARSVGRK